MKTIKEVYNGREELFLIIFKRQADLIAKKHDISIYSRQFIYNAISTSMTGTCRSSLP